MRLTKPNEIIRCSQRRHRIPVPIDAPHRARRWVAKFKISCSGSPVTTGVYTLQIVKWSNEITADPVLDATPTDAATTGNQFRLANSEWHFNLDTKAAGMSTGKWQIIATLSDGSLHSAWIQLK